MKIETTQNKREACDFVLSELRDMFHKSIGKSTDEKINCEKRIYILIAVKEILRVKEDVTGEKIDINAVSLSYIMGCRYKATNSGN